MLVGERGFPLYIPKKKDSEHKMATITISNSVLLSVSSGACPLAGGGPGGVAVNADGSKIATASTNHRSVFIHTVNDCGKSIGEPAVFRLSHVLPFFPSICFVRQLEDVTDTLLVCRYDSTIAEVSSAGSFIRSFRCPHGLPVAVAFCPRTATIAVSTFQGVFFFRYSDAVETSCILMKHPAGVFFTEHDNSILIVDEFEHRVSMFDLGSGKLLRHVGTQARNGILNPVAVLQLADGSVLVAQGNGPDVGTAAKPSLVHIDVDGNTTAEVIEESHLVRFHCLAYSPKLKGVVAKTFYGGYIVLLTLLECSRQSWIAACVL